MSETLYVSRCRIESPAPLHRTARLETGVTVDMGVHGPIREHYRLTPERELTLPVDYVVAAAGG